MNFERGQDPKDALDIGMKKAVRNIIRRNFAKAENFTYGIIVRDKIVKDIQTYTGWKEVKDISSYDYPNLFKFRTVNEKNGEVRIIIINLKE